LNPAKWDEAITANYAALVRMAKKHSPDAHDLLHHTYLRCRELPFPENFMAYMAVAMFREATRGQFRKLYTIREQPLVDVPAFNDELELSIQREHIQLWIDRLSYFDRNVITLYMAGHKLTELAKETDIPVGTFYQSIHRTKKLIHDAINNPGRTK
jgi:RNA polymerase sigma factor (sigma-70 family)